MPVRIVAGELMTGKILVHDLTSTKSGATWAMSLNQAGKVGVTVPLGKIPAETLPSVLLATEPVRCFAAAVTDDGYVLEAGPIWAHNFNDRTGNLRLTAAGMWSYFSHRMLLAVLAAEDRAQDWSVTYSGLSLGTIAKRLVQLAQSHTGGSVPVVLPGDESSTHARTYYGYELAAVGERLDQITEVDGGPDIAFQPRLTTDGEHIEWVMRTGTAADPLLHQVGEDWQWDRGAPRSELRLLSVDVDASKLAGRAWAIGSGMETRKLLSMAEDLTLVANGYPLVEVAESHTTVTEQSTLDAHAAGLLGSSRRPWQTWSLETSDTEPTLGTYRPGDWATVSIPAGHLYLREGAYRSRIVEISGGLSRKVSLALAPTLDHR